MITKFKVTPRSNIGFERYAGVEILVDGSQTPAARTPNPNTENVEFDMLSYATGESLTGTEFKLDWSNAPDGHYAQVEWLEIEYQRILFGNSLLLLIQSKGRVKSFKSRFKGSLWLQNSGWYFCH